MNDWISVEDRLPEDDRDVLGIIKTEPPFMRVVCYVGEVKGWFFCGYKQNVTHWMPLPEPPKK